uniref:Glycosyltransferase RgtA/B/C/D-like domain-containing protein n=2 Tax=Cupriavidus TaxID=106589 RepID=Q474S5_CUPPJ
MLPIVVFALLAASNPREPGLYMDAANPDYVSAWLARGTLHIPSWIYTDNVLAGEYVYPLLNSLYGGNLPAYLALLFFRTFGFGLEQMRYFHACFGVAVLLAVFWSMRQWRLPRLAVVPVLLLLAIDPNFVFAWRTQYYLQLVPLIFLFVGLGVLGRHKARLDAGEPAYRYLWLAGIFLGFAGYCYFTFAIYAATIFTAYLFVTRRQASIFMTGWQLAIATLIGWSPFAYAHASIALQAGWPAYLDTLRGLQTSYGVIDSSQASGLGRLATVGERVSYLFGARSMASLLLGGNPISPVLKWLHALVLCLGLVFSVLTLPRAVRSSVGRSYLAADTWHAVGVLILAIMFGQLLLGLAIGKPLGLQHYIAILPALYVLTMLMFANLFAHGGQPLSARGRWSVATGFVMFAAINIVLTSNLAKRLERDGGYGLYSEAINLVAEQVKQADPKDVLLFPQWGYWMGVVTLTGPRHDAVQTLSLGEMVTKLRDEAWLKDRKSFLLVVGSFGLLSCVDPSSNAASFASQVNLKVESMTRNVGRDMNNEVLLVRLTRR